MDVPMRRKEHENSTPEFFAHVLSHADELYVAFCTDGAPYVLPLNHVYVDGKIYFHCALEGRKISCIKNNAQVGFSTATDVQILPEKATTWFKSVVGTGRMRIVEDAEEKIHALAAITRRFQAQCEVPATPKMLARTAVLCLEIESICGKEKSSTHKA